MRIYNATRNTLRGLTGAAKNEPALRQEIVVLALAVPVGLAVAPSAGWYVAMIGALLMLVTVELLNTAIEKLADRVTLKRDSKIGLVKDIGSAAVFCALCLAGLVWLAALAVRFDLIR